MSQDTFVWRMQHTVGPVTLLWFPSRAGIPHSWNPQTEESQKHGFENHHDDGLSKCRLSRLWRGAIRPLSPNDKPPAERVRLDRQSS